MQKFILALELQPAAIVAVLETMRDIVEEDLISNIGESVNTCLDRVLELKEESNMRELTSPLIVVKEHSSSQRYLGWKAKT